ncbi:hypothetical protein BD289DRAFT_482290 [Coniella lustricola]|uniref:Uncharacterized protein n=1 Tax=Coniella lustricola TaxID=2025994 RepID=A0A2T3A9F0_9PEZI|nr:hypothetical protein BD289DRAFT_482290 [Coniella lustricola]
MPPARFSSSSRLSTVSTRAPSTLFPRQSQEGASSSIIITSVVLIALVALLCLFLFLRLARARNADAKWLPKPLRNLWRKWDVGSSRTKTSYSRAGSGENDTFQQRVRMREAQDSMEDALHTAIAQQNAVAARQQASADQQQDGVNRNTSVRSVMTLPAYRPKATETEQVLGREGERDGIDTVVELPTAEEEEVLREDEMEALYQIRLARRRQIAEREARRQERQEARQRHDNRALAEIRSRARQASEQAVREVEDLRGQHDAIKQSRQRAVSSVSYADLGVVRADGTRLRANSNESERMGLLSDAASIALSTRESGASSSQHRRLPSSHSVLSVDTLGSHNGSRSRSASPNHGANRSRAGSSSHLTEGYSMATLPRSGSAQSQRAGSSPELIEAAEADIGDSDMPLCSPPGYDDVSLEEITPPELAFHPPQGAHSGRNSPYNEPPPDYDGPEQRERRSQQPDSPTRARQNRLSAQMADLAAQQQQQSQQLETSGAQASSTHTRTTSRGVGGVPQLPSLRLTSLPQIVIEPSSARPLDEDENERL